MEQFGLIIRTLRKQRGMTQAALAEEVCSLKHLYSIERGIRTPSGYMLGQLGRKLGVNLFAYFPYLECLDPVSMKEAMDRMAKRRRQLGYSCLMDLRRELECLEDFRRPPWCYELDLNEYTCRAMEQGNPVKLARLETEIRDKMEDIEGRQGRDSVFQEYRAVLALCLLAQDRQEEALREVRGALACSEVTLISPRGREYHLLYRIIELVALYRAGRHPEAVGKSRELERLEKEWNLFEMGYFGPFVRAASCAALHKRADALEALCQGACICLSSSKGWALQMLSRFVDLRGLAADFRHESALVEEFLRRYPFLEGREPLTF